MKILFPYMSRWKALCWSRYHSLLSSMAEMGHEILVIQSPKLDSNESNYQDTEVELNENINLIDVHIPAWLWDRRFPMDKIFKKAIYCLWSFMLARKLVRKENIDYILINNIPQYPFLWIRGPGKIFDFADDYVEMLKVELGQMNTPAFSALAEKVIQRMVKKSELVFAASNVLALKTSKKAVVLPNGVDTNKVSVARATPLSMEWKRPVVGFIGSFEYWVDFELMLDLAARLPEVTFLFVGKGRLWEKVRADVRSRGLANVVLTGGVPHMDILRHIDRMDICLNMFKRIPISHSACPIKLFEYVMMRKPVISTRLDELKYIDKGYLFYADTAEEAEACVRRLLSDEGMRNEVVGRGSSEVEANYTWGGIAGDFERHLSSAFRQQKLHSGARSGTGHGKIAETEP